MEVSVTRKNKEYQILIDDEDYDTKIANLFKLLEVEEKDELELIKKELSEKEEQWKKQKEICKRTSKRKLFYCRGDHWSSTPKPNNFLNGQGLGGA